MTVKELRELLARATKGPFRVSMSGYSIKSDDPDVPIVAAVHGGVAATHKQIERWLDNADVFVALRNSADAMLDVVDAAKYVPSACLYAEPCIPANDGNLCWRCRLVAALAKLEGAGK